MPWLAAAREGLHAAATAQARPRPREGLFERGFGRLGVFWARRQGEQLARVRNVSGSGACLDSIRAR